MTTSTIRKKLITYLADADDSKVKPLYILLERELEKKDTVVLTNEQLVVLENERELHLSGQSNAFTREKAKETILSRCTR